MIYLCQMNYTIDSNYLNKLKHVAVFGASGAIGAQFLSVFESTDSIQQVYAFSRQHLAKKNNKTTHFTIDYSNEGSIIEAKKQCQVIFNLIALFVLEYCIGVILCQKSPLKSLIQNMHSFIF